jgi:hypothetical protein
MSTRGLLTGARVEHQSVIDAYPEVVEGGHFLALRQDEIS